MKKILVYIVSLSMLFSNSTIAMAAQENTSKDTKTTITAKTGVDYLKEIRKSTKLTEKHYKIIEQQTTSTEDVILEKEN